MLSESVIRSLRGIAGSDNILTSKEDRLCYAYDATNQRGAGTGLSGGSIPVSGGVVLSLERMRRILNIAECAGGPRSVKYGVTRDYVLGLEVVLPTGEIMEAGTQTVKGVTGYDLTRLIVGSEGTLGIVTKATLRLLPFPEAVNTILGIFVIPQLRGIGRR